MAQVKKPPIIDAEFTVVRGPPTPRPWNGVGVPPDWPTWGWLERITYVVIFGAIMGAVIFCARMLAGFIFPLH